MKVCGVLKTIVVAISQCGNLPLVPPPLRSKRGENPPDKSMLSLLAARASPQKAVDKVGGVGGELLASFPRKKGVYEEK